VSNRASDRPWLTFPRLALPVILTTLCSVPAIGQTDRAIHEDLGLPVGTRTIQGEVRMTDHKPLPSDTKVRLQQTDGRPPAEERVDSSGKFEFGELTRTAYRLTVTAEGYQTVIETIDMTFGVTQQCVVQLVPIVTKTPPPPGAVTDLAAPKRARREFERGSRELEGGKLEAARKYLEKAVAEDPCYARAQTALGVTLTRQQQWAEAEAAFRKSIKCDGGFLEGYVQLALLLRGQEKYEECSATVAQALRLFPNEWRLHYQLGKAKQSLGDYATAEQEYLKARALNATPPPGIHLQLAVLYRSWKKYDSAQAEMEAYLRADPNGEFAELTRKMLRDLQASGLVSSVPGHADQGKP